MAHFFEMKATQNEPVIDDSKLSPEQELMSLRFVQAEALASGNIEDSLPTKLTLRKMPVDAAVAPLLPKPITPFEKTERKKAHTSAVYYSECFLKGVTPKDADSAAADIQGRYKKWWVDSGFKDKSGDDGDAKNQERDTEKHRVTSVPHFDDDSTVDSSVAKRSSHYISDSSHHSSVIAGRKRPRRRGGVRDMIQDNTVDPHQVPLYERTTTVVNRRKTDDFAVRSIPNMSGVTRPQVEALRDELVEELRANGGDTDCPGFKSKLAVLSSFYLSSDNDARAIHGNTSAFDLDGTWLTLSKPTYQDNLGTNVIGQYIYKLGSMSFDMFRPTGLQCSIQGTFNTIHAIDPASEDVPVFVPRRLRKEVRRSVRHHAADSLRTYNIVVAFTIEPNQTRTGLQVRPGAKTRDAVIRQPVRGIMTNYGYVLPDPEVPNRLSIWFTGGTLEVNDEESDLEEWKRIFDEGTVPRRDMREFARLLAAKVLLGAHASDELEPDGSMSYTLKRPIGGHGSAFCDVLYMDECVRIMRGHHGSLFVFSKVVSSDEDRVE